MSGTCGVSNSVREEEGKQEIVAMEAVLLVNQNAPAFIGYIMFEIVTACGVISNKEFVSIWRPYICNSPHQVREKGAKPTCTAASSA